MQIIPKNYNSSGTASDPPSYDYSSIKAGDLIMITGTATDSKIAWTNTYKVTAAPGSAAADIPSVCQSHVYADRGAQGKTGPEASVEILVTNIDALSRTITLEAYLRTVATVSSRTYRWYKNGNAIAGSTSQLQISGDDLNATYECEIEWS